MKNKPTGRFFLAWFVMCAVLDLILTAFLHGRLAWNQLPGVLEGAILGAVVTWFIALLLWYKAQDRF